MDDAYAQNGEPPEWWDDEESEPPLSENIEDVDRASEALSAALLCSGSYAQSVWALDCAAGAADPGSYAMESYLRQDRDALARALYFARALKPLGAEELGMPAGGTANGNAYTMARGQYRCGSLSEAIAASEESGGKRILRICVRGTEPNSDPDKLVAFGRLVLGYFLGTYLSIGKHSKNFEPLAKAAAERLAAGEFDEVAVCGHSLGGAAASDLAQRIAQLSGKAGKVKCITFGSPGTGRGLRAFGDWAVAKAKALAGASPAPKAEGSELGWAHYVHPRDPVPRAGSLLYEAPGPKHWAMNPVEWDDWRCGRTGRGSRLATGLAAHSMQRYAWNIEQYLRRAVEDHRGERRSEVLDAWNDARREALDLEEALPAASSERSRRRGARGAIEQLRKLGDETAARRLEHMVASQPEASEGRVDNGRRYRKLIASISKPSI